MHPSHTGLERAQALFHPPILLGMGVAPHLGSKPWGLSVVVLTQGNVGVRSELNQSPLKYSLSGGSQVVVDGFCLESGCDLLQILKQGV